MWSMSIQLALENNLPNQWVRMRLTVAVVPFVDCMLAEIVHTDTNMFDLLNYLIPNWPPIHYCNRCHMIDSLHTVLAYHWPLNFHKCSLENFDCPINHLTNDDN